MKNLEKYPKTADALKAYAAHRKSEGLPLEEWLDRECAEPKLPTLLEAAEAVTTAWYADGCVGVLKTIRRHMTDLANAIEREKCKPVRNLDRYATVEEAHKAFMEMCKSHKYCKGCPFKESSIHEDCRIKWLYAEAGG